MKLRNGFVSNSSSSSFIVIAKQVTPDSVSKADIESGKIYGLGDYLNEGYDFFPITAEMFDIAKSSRPIEWFLVEKKILSEGFLVKLPPYSSDFGVMSIEIDNHSTIDLDTLKERYKGR